ncbi:MAG: hypothetical protein F6K30_29570 [Cyanothece sp. SIO2G6]|nr:hypothetical protein [Cyanothece sp. SIO2G6]
MDLMGMVNQAIQMTDTEADNGIMGTVLGVLNDTPVDNSKIGSIASALQQVLQNQGDASSLMTILQTVVATGVVDQLLASEQVSAIATQVGVEPEMVSNITPIIAQFLTKGSNSQGDGLLNKVLSGEVDLGQMANLISMAGQFM